MTYLLDTHVFLWVLANPDLIPPKIRTSLADRDNPLLVSAISAFEIGTKARLGKLEVGDLPFTFMDRVEQIGAAALPVSVQHAMSAGSLSWAHRDPFDRILVAQAMVERITLVTKDPVIAALPTIRVLSWA